MHLEIVSPEATLFSGDVTSIAVPGVNGEFEMLTDHAPIVSLLKAGHVKIYGDITLEEEVEDKLVVHRARRVQRFLSQPFHVAEQFTGIPGVLVDIKDTIKGFNMIMDGELDKYPEAAFNLRGSIQDAIDAGEKMLAEA